MIIFCVTRIHCWIRFSRSLYVLRYELGRTPMSCFDNHRDFIKFLPKRYQYLRIQLCLARIYQITYQERDDLAANDKAGPDAVSYFAHLGHVPREGVLNHHPVVDPDFECVSYPDSDQ